MKTAYLYIRDSGKGTHNTKALQMKSLMNFVRKHDIEVKEIFVDYSKDRPALKNMMEKTKQKTVDYVITTDFGRLTRSMTDLLKIFHQLKKRRILLLDSGSHTLSFPFIFAVLAEIENQFGPKKILY